MEPVTDGKFHKLYIISNATNSSEEGTLILSAIQFTAGKESRDIVRNR
jgi:hypothetical protein